ncbi:anthranilate synthase component I family protein [Pseudodesulfovibrio sp. S3]|nr:anthranilate synthase component I family protein [Pseudodesulfovibrio sp. S3]
MLLSADGYPAQTASVIGVRPVDELVFTNTTAPETVKTFCFGSPGPALGFVSYEYGMGLRNVSSSKSHDFPLGHLKKYAAVITYQDNRAEIVSPDTHLAEALADRLSRTPNAHSAHAVIGLPGTAPELSLDQTAYEAGVGETLERILSGHTYQLNLSTRFSWHCPDLDALGLFLSLKQRHPAPFYAWITSGPKRVLSTSPERFLRVQEGRVLSQPIKGTCRLGKDRLMAEERLTGSAKESAELSMIVDLVRNDISANCEYGSVRVEHHKSVFAVDGLLQMYSDVCGVLRSDRDCLDLFFDAFPGGSITGCPKKRSMEIIEELEPHTRGVYCGSVVCIRDERNMDSSIAIRTAVHDTDTGVLESYAGSGIVVDSNPAREYQETLAKAAKFLALGES